MTLKALYAAATGMEAQEARIAGISNNLANINTTGYKSDRAAFEDLMYDQIQTPGTKNSSNTLSPIGVQVGHGTRLVGIYKHFTQGELIQTNRELDVAIEGNGFLQVTMDDGTIGYTRDGSIRVDNTGRLVNSKGLPIEPSLTLPTDATSVTVGRDGTISVTTPGASTAQEVGQLQVALFQNPAGLKAIGQNLFQETEASGTPTTAVPGESGSGTLAQGFLENSNVNVAEELINMIIAQRSYEANSKVMQTSNEMMRSSTNVI